MLVVIKQADVSVWKLGVAGSGVAPRAVGHAVC